jgi:hypothetical protein
MDGYQVPVIVVLPPKVMLLDAVYYGAVVNTEVFGCEQCSHMPPAYHVLSQEVTFIDVFLLSAPST